MTLTHRTIEGHDAAHAGQLATDCPYMATSPSWAAWLYGFALGCNNGPIHLIKAVTQSRGYTLRVRTIADVHIVPYPDAKAVR
jgi:hypothetical protein